MTVWKGEAFRRPGVLLQPILRFPLRLRLCRLCRLSGKILLAAHSCGARVLWEEVTQRLQRLLSLWKPFCKPVYSGPSRPGKPFSQRPWSQWGLTRGGTLAIVLLIACAIAFIVCKARSVAVRSSFKASWYTWPDSSIPQRSLAWNSWRTAIVCSADPAWPAAA